MEGLLQIGEQDSCSEGGEALMEGVFAPAWFEPETVWVYRDDQMIDELKDTAAKLWERIHLG